MNNENTLTFSTEEVKQENIARIMKLCETALEDRGYNVINQIAGYLISNDPAYISSHQNARGVIQSVERFEIIEELVRFYLANNKK